MKCHESGQSEYPALLDWHNMPSEGIGSSPSQRFLGQLHKTLLPITGSLFHPRHPTEEDTRAIDAQKLHQKFYYKRQIKHLKPIVPGETVPMQLLGESTDINSHASNLKATMPTGETSPLPSSQKIWKNAKVTSMVD